jgi:hypothetical protein
MAPTTAPRLMLATATLATPKKEPTCPKGEVWDTIDNVCRAPKKAAPKPRGRISKQQRFAKLRPRAVQPATVVAPTRAVTTVVPEPKPAPEPPSSDGDQAVPPSPERDSSAWPPPSATPAPRPSPRRSSAPSPGAPAPAPGDGGLSLPPVDVAPPKKKGVSSKTLLIAGGLGLAALYLVTR